MTLSSRASGLLLPVTSLPSAFGIGDLGPDAHRFVDFLAHARQQWWQVLPIGPFATGDHSPYRLASAFAANPLLISPALLVEDGLLDAGELVEIDVPQEFSPGRIDYTATVPARLSLLQRACGRFAANGDTRACDDFCERHAGWLEPFARFRARMQPGAVDHAIRREMCLQFMVDRQWRRLRDYAHARGVHILGDIPFYVDADSADVWSRPELFKLDRRGQPMVVSGVPPDAFSETGQLWGNPVYDWAVHARDGYAWWVERIRRSLDWFDAVRLDHFRGFAAHWEVPAGSRNAMRGEWAPGPGRLLFEAIAAACPMSALIAEDLGSITDDVRLLLDAYHLPGMKVLLFAFDDDANNTHVPHRHHTRSVVYTGTHDNNTVRGWFEDDASPAARERLARYVGHVCTPENVSDALVHMAMMSVCNLAILPVQDILGLGAHARINRPATARGNWTWRLEPGRLTPELAHRLAQLTETYGRI
ncbi:MAG TPA: 4-alpha-glucanotransferase [Candidatus Krumholzibacteria bacterium]|nr:4-alpha-glucanotransferase [Candidatus Krumholzibacteria bacterium]